MDLIVDDDYGNDNDDDSDIIIINGKLMLSVYCNVEISDTEHNDINSKWHRTLQHQH